MSRGPTCVGICQSDSAGCAAVVNSALQRLTFAKESGDTGWWTNWAEMVFNVQSDGYLTTPREVARLERMTVCNREVPIQNQFYVYLQFGIGKQPQRFCNFLQTYERGIVPTFSDFVAGNKLRVYLTDATDAGKRVLIQGTDANDAVIYSLDSLTQVTGEFLVLEAPFVEAPMILNSLTGIEKDITNGPVKFYETNPTTGDIRLILTMEPGEKVAAYRRYFINGLPTRCCNPCDSPLRVTAIAKLDYVPVQVDTDYLVPVQNLEAITEEAQSIRYSTMDTPAAAGLADKHHRDAIRILNGELIHFQGKDKPAIEFKPFGSASLRRAQVGILT